MPDKWVAPNLDMMSLFMICQVGIPVFCCMGYCLSLYTLGCRWPFVCEETAGFAYSGMVYETWWPDSCVWVEFQRRQPTCSCMVYNCLISSSVSLIKILQRATFRVFKIERKLHGREDVPFLERVFQKLLLNFTWCVFFVTYIHFCSHALNSGGSTEKIRVDITCLKAGSWDLITLVCSIDRRRFPPVEHYARPMGRPGWHSTAWICK